MTNHPNRSKNRLRPVEHLRIAGQLYPMAWKQYDFFRSQRGKDGFPDWPEWCYCPLAAAYAVVSGGGDNRVASDELRLVAAVGALGAWRVTQTVYRFDPALAAELVATPIERLPSDVLYHLPEWCVYIEHDTQWYDRRLFGFFAHLEYDAVTGRPELRLLLDFDDENGMTVSGLPIHIDQPTLDEAMEAMVAEAKRQSINHGNTLMASGMPTGLGPQMADAVRPLLGLLLYLCSERPDLGDFIPTRPQPKRTKKGWRLFPPDAPQVVTVGRRIGDELRRAYLADQTGGDGERKGPRPHIRRAHWHTYRTGPGRTVPVLRWLSPIAVGLDGDGDIPVTIKEIKP